MDLDKFMTDNVIIGYMLLQASETKRQSVLVVGEMSGRILLYTHTVLPEGSNCHLVGHKISLWCDPAHFSHVPILGAEPLGPILLLRLGCGLSLRMPSIKFQECVPFLAWSQATCAAASSTH